MENNIIIRFAKADELEQVNQIRKSVHELHVRGRANAFQPDGWREIKDVVTERFDSEKSSVVVACFEDMILGFAIVQYIHRAETAFRPAQNFCHIEEFGVDQKFRRQGIASALIDFIRDDALSRGFEKLELNMYEFNDSALKFYESVGFQTYRRDLELLLEES